MSCNFKTILANIILPETLASECAKGNHICTGTNGVLAANDINNIIHIKS
jgi:hypothetical protein